MSEYIKSKLASRVHPLSRAPGSRERAYILATDTASSQLAYRLMELMFQRGIDDASADPQTEHMAAALIARVDSLLQQQRKEQAA